MNIFADISLWWLIPWAILSLGLAWLYYRKQKMLADVSHWTLKGLIALRSMGIFILGLLLMGLLFEDIDSKSQKPVFITLVDNSASMLNYSDSGQVNKQVASFQSRLKDQYGDRFDWAFYTIGSEVGDTKATYDQNASNLEKGFEQIYTQYYNQNIGGICLISDGNYNTGGHPQYSAERIALTPVFSLGVGDTIKKKDQVIRNVSANEITFYRNQFPVQIDIQGIKTGKVNSEVTISRNGKKLVSEVIRYENGTLDFNQVNALLDADEIGFLEYIVEVKPLSNESGYENNRWSFYVEVIDSRSKILMLSRAPHPDVAAIKSIIETDENVEVKSLLASEWTGKLDEYSLLIWHDPGNQPDQAIIDEIKRNKLPVWYILGTRSSQQTANRLGIPVNLPRAGRLDDAQVSLKSGFQLFELSDKLQNAAPNWPPLIVPFGGVSIGNGSAVLTQRIGPVVKSDPVWAFGNGSNKQCLLIGEGIWRWKLMEYARTGKSEGFRELIGKTVQYLLVKRNTDALRIHMPRRFTVNEDVIINAEFYNSSLEQITEPEISFRLKDENGSVVNYVFAKAEKNYRLVLGQMKPGRYDWTASAQHAGKKYEKSGSFVVSDVSLEHLESSANHAVLRSVAAATNGSFHQLKNADQLIDDIGKRQDMVTVHYEESTFKDIVDYPWLFVFVILILGFEWFVRRRIGTY